MNCCNCNKELDNEIIAFCEKCEEYYCMKCTKDHNHGLSFFEYKNNDEYKNCIPIEERIKFKINLGVEISTYITWNSIKLKELEV